MLRKSEIIAVACCSVLTCCETFGAMHVLTEDVMIRSEILGGVDWNLVYNITKEGVSHSTSTASAYGGGGVINWTDVKNDALKKGSPVAQFCLYQYLHRMSNKYTNGIKEELRNNAIMLLLISALKGNFHGSKNDLTYCASRALGTLTFDGSTTDIVDKLQITAKEILESE